MKKKHQPPKRHYPAIYERLIPWLIAVMAVAVIILVVIILSVPLGLFPGR